MNHVNDALNERRNADLRREQFDLDARRSAKGMGVTAATGMQTPLAVETREAPKGDRDAVFKAALAAAPALPLFKSETPTERTSDREVAMTRTEQEQRATNLIKLAHSHGEKWNPFAESQTSSIAKLHAHVGLGEVGEIDIERGEIRISKAA
ncbi:MAG: hypothetical protein ACLQBD_28425 [Syntrophobacteraceae bacterium]